MGFPIIDEIWSGIQWLVDFFFNKTPRPLQYIMFLLMLISFGFIISFFLHLIGVHCDNDKQVQVVDWTDFSTNLRIIGYTKDTLLIGNDLTLCDVHPDLCGDDDACYYYAKPVDVGSSQQTWSFCNSTDSTCKYIYRWGNCFNCTTAKITFSEGWFERYWEYCVDDVQNNLFDQYSRNIFDGCFNDRSNAVDCYVPRGFIWNVTTGVYNCVDEDVCGVNATKAEPLIDEKLRSAGAQPMYDKGTSVFSLERMVGISCDNSLNPQITFMGIQIFSYVTWVFIFIIAIMIYGLMAIRK